MNNDKTNISLITIKDFIPTEYITPESICTYDMPFAKNIRLAGVSVNIVVFSETYK